MYVKDFILAQLIGKYRLFEIPFHVQTNCSQFDKHIIAKKTDKN